MHFMQCLIMLCIKLITYNGVVLIFIAIIMRAGQLYRCLSFLKQDMCTIYKPWIRPISEYDSILYSGAAITLLADLQSQIEQSCSFVFQPLYHC